MKTASIIKPVSLVLLPLGLLLAIVYVQSHVLPERDEIAVRVIAGKLGLIAVPLLVGLAYQSSASSTRTELPPWRNTLGVASIFTLSLIWLCYAGAFAARLLKPTIVLSLDWTATLLETSLFAAALATALKGISRALTLGAFLLVWAYLESGIYH